MRKLFLVIALNFLLSACESISSSPNPYKSNRTFSNIDRVTYSKFNKKIIPHTNISSKKHTDLNKYNLNNFYDQAKPDNEANQESAVMINNVPTQGIFKIGNPYEVQGVSYFPQNYDEFEETGQASWYGPDFHGKPTANGEIYDSSTMTAAHPTLPLPSMIRVTNLRNGKAAILRVNDRGPFAKNRVIDVSEKAAEELGFKDYGTTDVHIQLLRNDTDELLAQMKIKN